MTPASLLKRSVGFVLYFGALFALSPLMHDRGRRLMTATGRTNADKEKKAEAVGDFIPSNRAATRLNDII